MNKFSQLIVAAVLICLVFPSTKPANAEGQAKGSSTTHHPTGAEILRQVRTRTKPLGLQAANIFASRRNHTFKQNIRFSDEWIMRQITYYDKADVQYREELKEMMEGGSPEGGAGMRAWLTDPQNEAFWNPTIYRNVGNVGYARIIALNAAFPAGSAEWRLVYGGDRRYNSQVNILSLNGTEFPAVEPSEALVAFPPNTPMDRQFDTLVKFSDAIRRQMFAFYNAFSAGRINAEQVRHFNQYYVIAGGCAISATAPKSERRSQRYLAAMNLLARTLGELGFEVRPQRITKLT